MNDAQREKIIGMLSVSYRMELETVVNYLANSIHLDGLHAQEIRESLEEDIDDELGHARELAKRIHVLDGRIPGSLDLQFNQESLQPPEDTLDIEQIVRGVIDAESAAIEQYRRIIEATDQVDYVTQDLCIGLKRDEEEHLRQFEGYLRDIQQLSLA